MAGQPVWFMVSVKPGFSVPSHLAKPSMRAASAGHADCFFKKVLKLRFACDPCR
jgi:hypothetical protein